MKRIVLCSDGTGNAEGKNQGTNVFKIYKAIERHDEVDHQVGFYDNGVGTDKYKLFRAIGGAFGFGFTRNVKDLYTFLARTYESGDEVFIFGFSRGAATVRAFAGFLHACGLVDFRSKHKGLDRQQQDALIDQAYAAHQSGGDAASKFKAGHCIQVPVKFVGVWDTVSALGFPKDLGLAVEWLEKLANKLFPHGFYDFELNDDIEHACHAMSLDDQRRTFEPMVWDENGKKTKVDQVWFAGMHSNVGGGYPRQGMSNTALHWLMLEAGAQGLKFKPGELERVRESADETGRMYDSRAGTGVYYRLQPRDLSALSVGKTKSIRIHETVLHRLELGTAGYAPGNLPESFEIVDTAGSTREASATALKFPDYRAEAKKLEKPIKRRQILQASFIRLSLVVAVLVILAGWKNWLPPSGWVMPMEIVAGASLLGCLLLLRPRLPKSLFWILMIADVGLIGASVPYWFPAYDGGSPFAWVLTSVNGISTWFIPSFLEGIAAQALVHFAGVTGILLFLFAWIWTRAVSLRDECDRISESARKALRGERPDLYFQPDRKAKGASTAS